MVAIYARQSLDKKDSISIETQIDMCKKEAPADAELKIYKDKGFSGKNIDRPSFQKLLEDIENGKISKVIVYRLDRISRSITDFANIIDILEKYNVDFASANEKFDTSTPAGRAMLYIIMVFAQLERETLAERIKDNYYSRGKTGAWTGGAAPFGFDNKKVMSNGKKTATIVPNKDIKTVKQIYNLYANTSISLGGLAKTLREERPNEMWNNIKLARILHNPTYVKSNADIYHFYKAKNCVIANSIEEYTGLKGCNIFGKRDKGKNKYRNLDDHVLVIGLHNGIIDSNTWLKCQQKLDSNMQIKNTGKGKHSWLTGLVKCEYSGYSMVIKADNRKGRIHHKYLNCSGKYAGMCEKEHKTHYLEEVEIAVFSLMKEKIQLYKNFKIKKVKENSNEVNTYKIELHKVEEQIENLLNSIAQGDSLVARYLNEKIRKLDEEKNEILNKINLSSVKKEKIVIPNLSDWDNLELEEKRDIAKSMISLVQIGNDSIKIEWKF